MTTPLFTNQPPKNDAELLGRCAQISGLTFQQLSALLQYNIPEKKWQRKGWVGQAIERVLGASAGTSALPDFPHLGIELKTLPLNAAGRPAESTFITRINLLEAADERWESSACWQKLRKVLWVPIEGHHSIPYPDRRIGLPFLWSPADDDYHILQEDWQDHMDRIVCGQLDDIAAHSGEYLQVRPKAADGQSLCPAYDEDGNLCQTLPRGFYLRSRFTAKILQDTGF
ncbi:MAG: DNA mismatch repair endonuclease MutH [Legionellaceae bacterium]|nr:DNA mismatch repair endonuclease MutH [Legionellaceae bacterium]